MGGGWFPRGVFPRRGKSGENVGGERLLLIRLLILGLCECPYAIAYAYVLRIFVIRLLQISRFSQTVVVCKYMYTQNIYVCICGHVNISVYMYIGNVRHGGLLAMCLRVFCISEI